RVLRRQPAANPPQRRARRCAGGDIGTRPPQSTTALDQLLAQFLAAVCLILDEVRSIHKPPPRYSARRQVRFQSSRRLSLANSSASSRHRARTLRKRSEERRVG